MAVTTNAVGRTVSNSSGLMSQIGDPGLRRYGGYVRDEFLTVLAGPRGVQMYREMRDNDPVIGAAMTAIELILRGVEWTVDSFDPDDQADNERAAFLSSCTSDMEHSWADLIHNSLTFLTFGWSLAEIVYKRRDGVDAGPDHRSAHNDGLIGWKKFGFRAQDTLYYWDFLENGEPVVFNQLPFVSPTFRTIPLEKCVLFRTTTDKDNPEGRSALRNAYTSYYLKKNLQQIEAIGIERDLNGIPMMSVPSDIMKPDADDSAKQLYSKLQEIVRNIRVDQQTGVIIPSDVWADLEGKPVPNAPMYKLELLSSSSRKSIDPKEAIGRYNVQIAMSLLADFLFLGHDKVGSFALSTDKTEMFSVAMTAYLDMIQDCLNRQAVRRLWELNGMPMDRIAVLKHKPIKEGDVTNLVKNITEALKVGGIEPGSDVDDHLRTLLGLPKRDEADRDPDERTAENEETDSVESEGDGLAERFPSD